jgi:hypothetical protein
MKASKKETPAIFIFSREVNPEEVLEDSFVY